MAASFAERLAVYETEMAKLKRMKADLPVLENANVLTESLLLETTQAMLPLIRAPARSLVIEEEENFDAQYLLGYGIPVVDFLTSMIQKNR